jgi:hypothetical protein
MTTAARYTLITIAYLQLTAVSQSAAQYHIPLHRLDYIHRKRHNKQSCRRRDLIRFTHAPRDSFDPRQRPTFLSYEQEVSWSAHSNHEEGADDVEG